MISEEEAARVVAEAMSWARDAAAKTGQPVTVCLPSDDGRLLTGRRLVVHPHSAPAAVEPAPAASPLLIDPREAQPDAGAEVRAELDRTRAQLKAERSRRVCCPQCEAGKGCRDRFCGCHDVTIVGGGSKGGG